MGFDRVLKGSLSGLAFGVRFAFHYSYSLGVLQPVSAAKACSELEPPHESSITVWALDCGCCHGAARFICA